MFCPNCGKPVKDGARFCGHCGARMDSEEEKNNVVYGAYDDYEDDNVDIGRSSRKRKSMWLLPLLIALLVLVGLGTAFAVVKFVPAFSDMLPWGQEKQAKDADADEDELERELEEAVEEDEADQKTAAQQKSAKKQQGKGEIAAKTDRETVPGKAADVTEEEPEDEDTAEAQISGASSYSAGTNVVPESSGQMRQTPVNSAGSSTASVGTAAAPVSSSAETAAANAYVGTTGTSADYVLPDSSSRALTAADLAGLSKDDLRLARNEIYARHGRIFTSEDLAAYFASKSWYRGTVSAANFSDNLLSQVEKDNIKLIKQLEEKLP